MIGSSTPSCRRASRSRSSQRRHSISASRTTARSLRRQITSSLRTKLCSRWRQVFRTSCSWWECPRPAFNSGATAPARSACGSNSLSATPAAFVAASAAPLWQAAVSAIGPLLPPEAQPLLPLFRALNPTSAQVGTQLAVLNTGTGTFDAIAPASVADFNRLRPTLSNVVELGYKGTIGSRLVLVADAWRQVRNDFVFFSVVTPNVFFDQQSLQTYLAGAFSSACVPNAAATAASFAPIFASLPLGTVQPDSRSVGPNDIVLSYRNFARVQTWGIDVGQELALTSILTAAATYSFLNKNLFTSGELQGDEVALNAPRTKARWRFAFTTRRARSERSCAAGM